MKLFAVMLTLLGVMSWTEPTHARLLNHRRALLATEQKLLSPSEAISIAEQQYGGKVLSIELIRSEGSPSYYRIKMISNGKVRIVRINAT